MSFGEAIHSVFSNYCQFSGRARRSEYWYFVLFNALVTGAISGALSVFSVKEEVVSSILSLWSLAVLLPRLGLIWRRFHDIGKSGANYFWVLVPLVGLILYLVWMCRAGDPGPNRFGPDPKNPDYVGENGEYKAPWEY